MSSHAFSSIIVLICLGNFLIGRANFDGFSVDLIHIDSRHSPLYNPHETHSQRLQKALQRSRFYPFSISSFKSNDSPQSSVTAINGNYLMKLSFGTPPLDIFGIVDTGSDLVWTQCLPCVKCDENYRPIFNPSTSSSYKNVPCADKSCQLVGHAHCSKTSKFCNYTYGYAGNEYTDGVVAKETITFGSTSGKPMSIKDIIIGCAHNVTVANTMGLIGLGGGPASLVTQIGSKLGSKKFSHCLVPFHTSPDKASKITFGDKAIVSGPGTVTTPLVRKDDPTLYYITVNGISVGQKFVPFSSSSPKAPKGNMFIDSGTVQPVLPLDFYKRLIAVIKQSISLKPFKDDGIVLCYKNNDRSFVPTLTVHFDGGDLNMKPIHTFIPQYPEEDLFCLSVGHTDPQWTGGIYGNFFQYDILMGFDLDKSVVSFKPTDCIKHGV